MQKLWVIVPCPSYFSSTTHTSRALWLGNGMASRNFAFLDNMRKLEKLVNRTKWSMTPPTVNAYYTPTKNQIVFPAHIVLNLFQMLKKCDLSNLKVSSFMIPVWNH